MNDIKLENAIRLINEARIELRRQWLGEPSDEIAAANTPVPGQYQSLADKLRAVHGHLLNLRDFD